MSVLVPKYVLGVYSTSMHEFVLREAEVGLRVATAEDDEACGFGPLFDALVAEHRQIPTALVPRYGYRR